MDERIPVEVRSGNVFADLGLPDPEERLVKAELGRQLRAAIADRGLTQAAAGRLLGLAQPHVSNLVRGKLVGFSVERLMGYLNALGQDVELVLTPAPDRERGRTTVTVAGIGQVGDQAPAGLR